MLALSARRFCTLEDSEVDIDATGGAHNIRELLSDGDTILVQVVKDPMGTKGARLTTFITIPSRYLVYMPNGNGVGVSTRIDDEEERERINPVGRVPALILSDDETLVDSFAILDHLDEQAGSKALVPKSGLARRQALQHISIATGAIDRAMTANAERRRTPPDDERLKRLLRQCTRGPNLFALAERAESLPAFSASRID